MIHIAANAGGEQIFLSGMPVTQRRRGVAFALSAVGHCAFFFLLPFLASVHLFESDPPLKMYVARMESLNLRVAEPIYAPVTPPPARRTESQAGSANQQSIR